MPERLWELTSVGCPGFTFLKGLNICRGTSSRWQRVGVGQKQQMDLLGGWREPGSCFPLGWEPDLEFSFLLSLPAHTMWSAGAENKPLEDEVPFLRSFSMPTTNTSFHNTQLPLRA